MRNRIDELDRLLTNNEGVVTTKGIITSMMKSNLFLASATEVQGDRTGLNPMVFYTPNGDMLAVFSNMDLISEFSEDFRYAVSMSGKEILSRLPSSVGIVVNPGSENGFEIKPDHIKKILSEYAM
ncbi:SseB family protein [Thalassolituus marinus]|nr:SseB family protein [Thalassolituus marinus]